MWEIRDGKIYFILIDFDLATVVTEDDKSAAVASSESNHQTGTLPFMAYELLTDMTDNPYPSSKARLMHRLHHDYESLLYLTCWSSISWPPALDDVQRTMLTMYLKKWESGTVETVANLKWRLCSDRRYVAALPLPLAAEPLRPILNRWFKLIRHAYQQWDDICQEAEDAKSSFQVAVNISIDFDIETFNGLIARDTIKKAVAEGVAASCLSLSDSELGGIITGLSKDSSEQAEAEDDVGDECVDVVLS